jgi:Phage protein Gp19/Gp15/Gp42
VTYATLTDVEDAYEGTVPDRTQNVIDRVERRLERYVANITARLALPSDNPAHIAAGDVRDVVVDAVMRQLRNPRGYTSERDGDYGYSYGRPGSAQDRRSPRSSWFTQEELDLLAPKGYSRAGTIDLGVGHPAPVENRWTRPDLDAWADEQSAHFTDRDVP